MFPHEGALDFHRVTHAEEAEFECRRCSFKCTDRAKVLLHEAVSPKTVSALVGCSRGDNAAFHFIDFAKIVNYTICGMHLDHFLQYFEVLIISSCTPVRRDSIGFASYHIIFGNFRPGK